MDTIDLLLVEDDRPQAVFVRKLLERSDLVEVRVGLAQTLAEGIALASERDFDLALLDLALPDATGLAGIKKLRRELPNLPVVVLTGDGDPWLALAALKLGAQDFLVKGQMDARELARAVMYAVTRHRALEEARESEASLRSAFDRAGEGVAVLQAGGVVLYANANARRLVGGDSDAQFAGRLAALDIDAGHTVELNIQADPGELRPVALRSTAIRWKRKPARLVLIDDLSDRRRAEQFRDRLMGADRLALIGLLSARMARDVNEPVKRALTACGQLADAQGKLAASLLALRSAADEGPATLARVAAQTLSAPWFDDEMQGAQRAVDDTYKQMGRVSNIVHDFLMLSGARGGDLEPVDLGELVDEACALLRREGSARLRVTQTQAGTGRVRAARAQLGLVMTGLLVNLADFGCGDEGACEHIHVTTAATNGQALVRLIATSASTDAARRGRRTSVTANHPGAWPGVPFCVEALTVIGGRLDFKRVDERWSLELRLPTLPANEMDRRRRKRTLQSGQLDT